MKACIRGRCWRSKTGSARGPESERPVVAHDDVDAERFRREIQFAAKLQRIEHDPCVCPNFASEIWVRLREAVRLKGERRVAMNGAAFDCVGIHATAVRACHQRIFADNPSLVSLAVHAAQLVEKITIRLDHINMIGHSCSPHRLTTGTPRRLAYRTQCAVPPWRSPSHIAATT